MKTSLGIVGLGLMLAFGAGCSAQSGDASSPENGDESEGALATQLISGAVAVEIDVIPMVNHQLKPTKVVLAAPSKLKKVLASVKKRAANEPVPRCMPSERIELHFLDAKGKELSKVDTSCGGFGNLQIGDASTPIKTSLDYIELSAEPLSPGDALWGITEVEVTKLSTHDTKNVKTASDVATLVGAIGAEQAIDPHKPHARCMPSYAITFKRANHDVANTSFICGSDASPPAKLTAQFSIEGATAEADPIVTGAVDLDPRPFVKLF